MLRVKTVAVLSDIPKLYSSLLKQLPSLQFSEVQYNEDDALEKLEKADVIVADANKIARYIYDLRGTKWIQTTWAGVEPIMREFEMRKVNPPCPITRFSGEHFGAIMSEYVVAQVTAFERDFIGMWTAQNNRRWETVGKIRDYKTFRDMTVGILGGGHIGSHISKVLKMLGARVWCLVKTIPANRAPHVDEYRKTHDLNELLSNCNLIVNVLPHSPSTTGLLNASNLENCREALFVNVGRGSIVTEQDLVEALHKEHLRGAILDVFLEEPLPTSSKLWDMPQVVITPHVAGVTRARDVAQFFEQNILLWEKEGRLLNMIDFTKGY